MDLIFPKEEMKMIPNATDRFSLRLISISLFFPLCGFIIVALGTQTSAQAQARSKTAFSEPATNQRPPFSDYKGVRIGMSTEEAKVKLGPPTREFENQSLYVISETETAQLFFDNTRKIIAISVDYLGDKSGAPDYKAIVGENIQVKPDGSMYKLVRYEQLGFWVSFNRTAGVLPIITVTIQKI